MSQQITDLRTITIITCGECGIVFGVPEDWRQARVDSGKTFYCPNGHARVYRETTADRLRKELEQETRRKEWAENRAVHLADQRDAAERSRAAMKGVATKAKKRVGKGVCPCCNRHFANVQRHMEGQHPDYATTEAGEAEA